MNKNQAWLFLGIALVIGVTLFIPELALAQYGGGGDFQTKIGGVTKGLVNVLLPAVSVLGNYAEDLDVLHGPSDRFSFGTATLQSWTHHSGS